MRTLTLFDQIICQLDNGLKTLVPTAASAHRTNPATTVSEATMDAADSKHAAGLMRINHTGEVCAQALYQGQSVTAKLSHVKAAMVEAAEEEIDHLVWCEERLHELNSHTSIFNPLFYGLSYGLGALAGALGDKYSLGFVAATENQVCKHLQEHLATLPEQDLRSRAILEVMYQDELKHATVALEAGGVAFPNWLEQAMTQVSKVMTKATYRC